MSPDRTDSSARSSRLGLVLGCAVLGPLALYVGLNLVLVNTMTLIHESRVEFVVLERGQPAVGVEIRPCSPSRAGPPSPITSAGALAPSPAASKADFHEPVVTDLRGRVSYGTHVQDQGTWLVPRCGVTRNLSGRSFSLRRPGRGPVEVTLPPYQGQTETFRIELGPTK